MSSSFDAADVPPDHLVASQTIWSSKQQAPQRKDCKAKTFQPVEKTCEYLEPKTLKQNQRNGFYACVLKRTVPNYYVL